MKTSLSTHPRHCILGHEGYVTNPSLYITAQMKGLEQSNEDALKAVISCSKASDTDSGQEMNLSLGPQSGDQLVH